MAKRFTATEKWNDPWFCALTERNRLFWLYLLDNCDIAGIWQANWPLVNFYFPGFSFDWEVFKDRVIEFANLKFLIPKFISFQYGALNPDNRLHLSVLQRLEKEGVSKDLISPLQGAKDKDREKDKIPSPPPEEKGEAWRGERRNHVGTFQRFWAAYPKRKSKGDAFKAWRALNPSDEQVSRILAAIDRAKTTADWLKEGGQFIPYPATWLRASGWEDELPEDVESKKREELDARVDAIIGGRRPTPRN